MGQAASMCRFRGCRYKKNKTNKNNNQQQQQQQQHQPPSSQHHHNYHNNSSSSSVISTSAITTTLVKDGKLDASNTISHTPNSTIAPIAVEQTTYLASSQYNTTCPSEEILPSSLPQAIEAAETTSIAATTTTAAAGLHLRSIEEPTNPAQYFSLNINSHNSYTNASGGIGSSNSITGSAGYNARTPTELGGTGYGSEQNLLMNNRTGVPLATYQQLHYQPQYLSLQQQQTQQQLQQHQQQQQYPASATSASLCLHPLSPQKIYDPEYARMEAWMDENQEFVQDYFIRKATRQVVDAWLVSHATSAGNDVANTSPTHPNGQNCSSRGGSGATTPVRKISAHEFERGGLLKPIVNTIDGTPTFLSIGTTNDCSASSTSTSNGSVGVGSSLVSGVGGPFSGGSMASCNTMVGSGHNNSHHNQMAGGTGSHNHHHHHHHHHNHYRPQRLSRNELKQLDEKELIFELVKDICNELEVRTLCHKILQNVSILLNADRGSLFLVQGRCSGGGDGPKKCLVSKLFDVCPRSTVEEMEQQDEVQIAWGTGIAGHVAESGEPVNIPDAYKDERFNCEIDTLTGYRTKALLCMPIKDSSGDVIGVAQVINKFNGECFSETDEKVFASYLQFCGIGLRNAQLYEKSQLEIKRNQVLLDLARMIFEEQSTIEHMVFRILTHMQSLIQCQRVQILLVHEASKGSFSRVFDFEANDLSEEESNSRTSPFESRFPINIGITGHVATTGETVNILNAYEDDRFDPSVDDNSNFQHKSILCMAIKNSLGQIIGVIQLINKFDNLTFTKNDENFVEAFAIFCGMGIHNTHMYEKAIVAMAKQSVTLEVLSYHASATMDEAHRLRRLRVPSAAHFRLHDFRFDDIHFEDDDTLKACLRMFLDLDFVERFHIDYEVLCRWLLSVKKNYRNVIYHNWRHAFNVAQMMFAILTATQWWKIFGEIECLALIIACLCHDLDHRGTNNSFQIKASSPLAQLYSTSTMEHHHFDQCLMILNSPGNQILANLSSEDYCRVIKVLEDAILSTDLAVYLRKRGTFLQNVQEHPMSYWVDEEPRALLRAMSMTVCDLSAITKPWDIEKRVADLVSSEFFEQGDMEKQELNITPIDIMNREKEDELPMMQVGFIDSICLPIYEAFSQLSDKLDPLVEGVRDNRQHWIDLAQGVRTKSKKSNGIVKTKITKNHHQHNNSSSNSNNNNSSSSSSNNNNNNNNTSSSLTSDKSLERCDLNSEINDTEDELQQQDITTDECQDEEETGIEADDDDSEIEVENHSNNCCSTESSRASTPPPTGEEDSSPTSPTKKKAAHVKQAKLIAQNLKSLNQNPQHKQRNSSTSCRSCECMRVRKTSSLKGADELLLYNGSIKTHSRSTPSMLYCGVGSYNASGAGHLQSSMLDCKCHSNRSHHHHHHHHHHHSKHHSKHSHHHGSSSNSSHHHHQNHHHQHHHHHHNQQNNSHSSVIGGSTSLIVSASAAHHSSNNSSLSESDKIPKIVGKLGNLDALHHGNANGNAVTNGPCNFLPTNFLSSRRHSETNGGSTTDSNRSMASPTPTSSSMVTPKAVSSTAATTASITPTNNVMFNSNPATPPPLTTTTVMCDK